MRADEHPKGALWSWFKHEEGCSSPVRAAAATVQGVEH